MAGTSQELDKQVLRCQYKLSYVKDTTQPNKISEDLMILEQGKNCSKFYSYYTFRHDSLVDADTKAGVPDMVMFTNRAKYGIIRSTYTVYNNYPSGNVTVVDMIGTGYYCYKEPVIVPQWQVKSEYDNILTYRCQKATCTFKGRHYEAWFTTAIPVNGGPWEFSGLPGLILSIKDTRNQYSFQCVGITLSNSPIVFDQREMFNVSKKEYDKTIRRYFSDPIGFLESSTGATIEGGRRTSDPYNPIDLSH